MLRTPPGAFASGETDLQLETEEPHLHGLIPAKVTTCCRPTEKSQGMPASPGPLPWGHSSSRSTGHEAHPSCIYPGAKSVIQRPWAGVPRSSHMCGSSQQGPQEAARATGNPANGHQPPCFPALCKCTHCVFSIGIPRQRPIRGGEECRVVNWGTWSKQGLFRSLVVSRS